MNTIHIALKIARRVQANQDEMFGELRSLLQQRPSKSSWPLITGLFNRMARNTSMAFIENVALPYAQEILFRGPWKNIKREYGYPAKVNKHPWIHFLGNYTNGTWINLQTWDLLEKFALYDLRASGQNSTGLILSNIMTYPGLPRMQKVAAGLEKRKLGLQSLVLHSSKAMPFAMLLLKQGTFPRLNNIDITFKQELLTDEFIELVKAHNIGLHTGSGKWIVEVEEEEEGDDFREMLTEYLIDFMKYHGIGDSHYATIIDIINEHYSPSASRAIEELEDFLTNLKAHQLRDASNKFVYWIQKIDEEMRLDFPVMNWETYITEAVEDYLALFKEGMIESIEAYLAG